MISSNKNGNLIVISGPSGVGKDSVIHRILELDPSISLSISCTTRRLRENEKNGCDYVFITKEEFKKKIDNSEFWEYAEYCGNYYGTLKQPIEKCLAAGKSIILKIDVQGAEKIKSNFDRCLRIFILPPSWKDLKERISLRNSETQKDLDSRLKRAKLEMEQSVNYDYIVVNDVVDYCANKILNIIYGLEEK
jgi:guanylate kinase